ncbi:MAG: hypothetical protein ACPHLK_09595 [Gammaproteobacteria bacterium]|jgi:hypothetical protein
MSKHEQDDKVLNDYLEGHSEISKSYRAVNKAEPSVSVDEKILSAAKNAIAEEESGKLDIKFHKSSWAKPVSIAAVITLSVSLIITMQEQTGQPLISEPKSMNDSLVSPTTNTSKTEAVTSDADAVFIEEAETQSFSDSVISEHVAPTLDAAESYRAEKQAPEAKLEIRERSTKSLIEQGKLKKKIERSIIAEESLYSDPAKANVSDIVSIDSMSSNDKQELLLEIKSLLEQGKVIEAKEKLNQFRENYPAYSEQTIKEVIGEELLGLLNSE